MADRDIVSARGAGEREIPAVVSHSVELARHPYDQQSNELGWDNLDGQVESSNLYSISNLGKSFCKVSDPTTKTKLLGFFDYIEKDELKDEEFFYARVGNEVYYCPINKLGFLIKFPNITFNQYLKTLNLSYHLYSCIFKFILL